MPRFTMRLLFLVAGAGLVGALRVGTGIADCTTPMTHYVFMGMANPKQRGAGLWTRQYARAFVFGGGGGAAQRVAFVSVDSAMIGHVLKKRVLARVNAAVGNGTYTYDNVVLSGIHTHSGSSGFLQHMIFQLAGSGFVPQTIDALTAGVADAIVKAHEDFERRTDRVVRVATGRLPNASANRSPTAYLLNPAAERALYDADVDQDFTSVRVDDDDDGGGVAALLSWFAVHPTSLNNTNSLVSGDHTGLASLLAERALNAGARPGAGPKVAAFASANLGDASPNIAGNFCRNTGDPCDVTTSTCPGASVWPWDHATVMRNEQCSSVGPGVDMFDSARIIADRQVDYARELLADGPQWTELADAVDVRHAFVAMPGRNVSDWRTGRRLGVLCRCRR